MKILLGILSGLSLVFVMVLLMALPTMWSWNYFMPKVFNLVEISFTDALFLNLLCSCLFKSTSSSK